MKKNSLVFILIFLASCKNNTDDSPDKIPEPPAIPSISFNIINTYPHDTTSFTEGLQWHNNALYESTGNKGSSKLLKIDLKTGMPRKELNLDDEYFGEGLTVLRDTLYQMTYQENIVFAYDANTFKLIKTFHNDNEGWGMTTDGTNLIVSDGSSKLYFRQPSTFKTMNIVTVLDNNGPVNDINELEYVDGYVYANIWNTNYIIKIDPVTGQVLGRADLSGILEQAAKQVPDPVKGNVLNGIAYNPETKTFYITGKYWPLIFEMKL